MTSKNDNGIGGGRRARAVVRAALAIAIAIVSVGCSRNRQEAVILANQADKEVPVNPDAAINKYEQATKLDPTNHRIFHKLAMAQKKKDEWDKVASTMSRAVQIAPKFANYWFERGWALQKQAQKKTVAWDEAKEPFLKCIENDPNFADCYHELGTVYLWMDDEQKALEYFTKAIEHDPAQIRYYGPLADLYIRTGYYKEAEGVLREAKDLAKPADKYLFGIRNLLAQIFQERGQMNEMISELEAAKAIAPPDGPEAVLILWSLGSSYAKLDPPRAQEAVQLLKGFNARACKGSKAQSFKAECESTSALIQKLGGTLQ